MGKNFYSNIRVLGNTLMYRGFENGERVDKGIKYCPKLYFRSDQEERFKTLDGINVKSCSYKSIKDAKNFIYEHKGVVGLDVYGYQKFEYCYLEEILPEKIDFEFHKLKILNFDIETRSEHGFPEPDQALQEIISIAVSYRNRFFILGLNDFTPLSDNQKFIKCENEIDLLTKFIRLWRNINPDIITGWNIIGFDIPYIVNRISRVIDFEKAKELSPYGFINQVNRNVNKQEFQTFDIYGVEILDYIHLYKKFGNSKPENYKLNTVAHEELGEKKVDYSEHGSLHQLYANDYNKFIEYNIKDVDIINKLEEKLKLIQMVVTTAYDAKINFSDVFHQVKIWENIIYCKLIKNNIVFPSKKSHSKSSQFRGAFVKESQVGMFEWVASYDVNSLYPSLLVQHNISPETLLSNYQQVTVEEMLEKRQYNIASDTTLTASGYSFSRSRTGFLPSIIEEMIKERFEYRALQKTNERLLDEINSRIKQLEA